MDDGFQGNPPNKNSLIIETKVKERGMSIILIFLWLTILLSNPIKKIFNKAKKIDSKKIIKIPSAIYNAPPVWKDCDIHESEKK